MPPFTVFSSVVDPAAVLRAVEAAGATLELKESVGDDWRLVIARWPEHEGLSLELRHDPAYYSGDSWAQQLPGMFRYFVRAAPPNDVLALIRGFAFSVSLALVGEPRDEAEDPRFAALEAVTTAVRGVVFVPDGLRDAQGRWVFRTDGHRDAEARPPAPGAPQPMFLPRGALYARTSEPAMRRRSCEALEQAGFAAAWGLPKRTDARLRDVSEVAARACALRALFFYVAWEDVDTAALTHAIERDGLAVALTAKERTLLATPRAEARQQWQGRIGWRLENLWALGWVLGFEPRPPVAAGMIDDAVIHSLLTEFFPEPGVPLRDWLHQVQPRGEADVIAEEDLFYVAHHAARAAQLGMLSVPPDFHPVRDGGVLHERRHALTWCVSPGVAWEDTDLST
jgi:hypothetical protein